MKSKWLFNHIAWAYQFFFRRQERTYSDSLKSVLSELQLTPESKILDIGCGTGALGSAFKNHGFEVLGIDNADKMIRKAKKNGVDCIIANALEEMNFEKDSFELVSAAFVAHGINAKERTAMMTEMARLSKNIVLFYDYGKKKKFFTSIIEWVERGDYFNFIKNPTKEMDAIFQSVRVFKGTDMYSWYVCIVN